jgi:DamX protein
VSHPGGQTHRKPGPRDPGQSPAAFQPGSDLLPEPEPEPEPVGQPEHQPECQQQPEPAAEQHGFPEPSALQLTGQLAGGELR